MKVSLIDQRQQLAIESVDRMFTRLANALIFVSIAFAAITAYATIVQARHIKKQTDAQNSLQGRLTDIHIEGAERVGSVLDVVKKTLESRLMQVRQERRRMKTLDEKLTELTGEVARLSNGVRSRRAQLERRAAELALTPRHAFRQAATLGALQGFAQDFESFKIENPEESPLSARANYVRGIAAHFNNDFATLQICLNHALRPEAADGEDDQSIIKRQANTYYYLGLNAANLGKTRDAVASFQDALRRDPQGVDMLTRIVMAEAAVQDGDFVSAAQSLEEAEAEWDGRRKVKGDPPDYELRLKCRMHLIRANMAILSDGYASEGAKTHAEQACTTDPESYYAFLTLAQVRYAFAKDTPEVRHTFREAYSQIQASRDLESVRETRSRILLLLTAAICASQGEGEKRVVARYLDEGNDLRLRLPKLKDLTSTVFSPLTKRNETSDTIAVHIDRIRAGAIVA